MNHQDWTPVVLTDRSAVKKALPKTVERRKTHPLHAIDVDPESNPVVKVSSTLKHGIIQARCAARLTREQLAQRVHVHIRDITDIETGGMSQREAKQIALKIERALHAKLL